MKQFIILVFSIYSLNGFCQHFVYHTPESQFLGHAPASFIFADSTSLRAQPSISGKFLKSLSIGTSLIISERSIDSLQVNGLWSHWYKIRLKDDSKTIGWVWGGFITDQCMGSNEDPEIKFLVGKSKVKKIESSEWPHPMAYIKIKAIKSNKLLDEVEIKYNELYIVFQVQGKRGVEGVHDVLSLNFPCHGGCGCYTGDQIYFWDGKKIHEAFFAGGSPDGHYSSGEELIFPSDAEGEKGYLIKREFGPDYDYIEKNPEKDMRTYLNISYLIWDGSKLVESNKKKNNTIYKYYENN